jgi:serine protease Do/serine protease DegQ
VVAIGNPFGLGQTVTSGIISALGRTGLGLEGYEDFIQTDAAINVGISGGALVNLNGELVGLNTAIFAPGGGNVGIGFAIPVNLVARLLDQILTYGEVRRGQLGVRVQTLTEELMASLNLASRRGAMIQQVLPDSAAARAGLREGDIVTSVDGRPVRNAGDLRNLIGLREIGEQVALEVLRNGDPITVRVAIGEVIRIRATLPRRQVDSVPVVA